MSYLCGHSLACALGRGQVMAAAPRPPAPQPFAFLGSTVDASYFRSFPPPRLNLSELSEHLHHHIQTAARSLPGQPAAAGLPLFIGSTAFTLPAVELRYPPEQTENIHSLHELADILNGRYGYRQIHTIATSCTSSAQALIQAHRMQRNGWIDQALVVGVESFNLTTLAHFHATGLLCEDYRPFAGNGFILGEGMACLALSPQAPNHPRLQLRAATSRTDTGSLTDTRSEHILAVMQQTLTEAGISAKQLTLIKAHGVGSLASDQAESEAIRQLTDGEVPVWWFKPLIGHTLGASGALESALLHQALQHGRVPAALAPSPVAGMNTAAPGHILGNGHYLSLFLGFGGNICCLLWTWQT